MFVSCPRPREILFQTELAGTLTIIFDGLRNYSLMLNMFYTFMHSLPLLELDYLN